MRRVRLVLLTGSLNIGGTERNVLHLASTLDPRRYDVEVWCIYRGHALEEALRRRGIRCRTFKDPSTGCGPLRRLLMHNVPFQWRLWRALRRHRPDVLHVFGFPAAYYGVLLGKLAGVRNVLFAVQDWDVWKGRSRIYRRLDGLCGRLATRIIADGAGASRVAVRRQGMPASRLKVIYDGVNIDELEPQRSREDVLAELGLDAARPVVAVIARLDVRKKGQDHFIAAIPAIAERTPEAQLLIVGGGPDEALVAELVRSIPEPRPVLAGFREDLADILNAIDILVIPSLWESVPKILLEAMWCGAAVVATRVGDIEEVLDASCGVLIPPADPAAIAEAVSRLVVQPEERRALARKARERIESRGLTLRSSIRRYDTMYAELARRKHMNGWGTAT